MSAISAQRRTPATRTPAAEASSPSLSAMALVRTVGQPEGGDECWRPQARLLPAAPPPVRICALVPLLELYDVRDRRDSLSTEHEQHVMAGRCDVWIAGGIHQHRIRPARAEGQRDEQL